MISDVSHALILSVIAERLPIAWRHGNHLADDLLCRKTT